MSQTNSLFLRALGTPGAPTLDELFGQCRPRFKEERNEWYHLGSLVYFRNKKETDTSGWLFKNPDQKESLLEHLWAVVKKDPADHPARIHMKSAIAGWMLSEILAGDKPPKFSRKRT